MNTPSLFDDPDSFNASGNNLLPKDGEALFFPHYFDKTDSDRLFHSLFNDIHWQQDQIKFFGKLFNVPRLAALYGDPDLHYSYAGIQMKPRAWIPELLEIKHKIEEIAKVQFTSVLVNLYRHGKDSNDWHCDNEKELGINPVIGSVSLGATRTFKFRHLGDKTVEKVELTHGSFVLMKGETQQMGTPNSKNQQDNHAAH
jgi:alkylated DNA repair dioxygenase AlkB